MDLLKQIWRVWALHREFRAVLTELRGYSDRELNELGIARGDIARLAYEEAEMRVPAPQPVDRRHHGGGHPVLALGRYR